VVVQAGKRQRIFTRNLTPGRSFFDEEQRTVIGGTEYRELDPRRSKLGAAIMKGCQQFGIRETSGVLYLGASHGYTPSFVSDMVPKGQVYCVDVAPRVVRDLVFLCEARPNMHPILADASNPQALAWRIGPCDVLFQDIAQRNQVEIFLRNLELLAPGSFGLLAVKARSIDVTKQPKDIFKEIKRRFETEKGLVLIDYRELEPFEKDHAFFVVKKR
jgi:fibrillarin-like pre-rRNA processing protein